jgi:hypothetical protein
MRLRESKHLPGVGSGEVPYALSRELLHDFTLGRIAVAVIQSKAWKELVAPRLDKLQQKRERPQREKPWYTTHELESLFLLQRVAGRLSYKDTRDFIAGDTIAAAEARRLLGLDSRRARPGRRRGPKGLPTEQYDGVPSKATMSRYLRLWNLEERREMYEQLFEALVQEHLELPEFQEECLSLYADGSPVLTHYTAPVVNSQTGEIVNSDKVTASDAGYVGQSVAPDKSGHGWNLISLVTRTALPISYTLPPLNRSEKVELETIVDHYREVIRPRIDARRVGILTTDGAFHRPLTRRAIRDAGLVENIHYCSHADTEENHTRADESTRKRIPISGYPGWYANAHREVICRHGHRAAKVIEPPKRNGRPVVRVEGKCSDGCATSISIESGKWRRAQTPDRFERCNLDDPDDRRDWALGNGLTFNDPEACAYGFKRFGRNEGFHGAMANRFGLLQKRWFRHRDQARIEAAVVFSIVHVIAMEYRRRLREADSPPPLACAA